MKSSQTLSTAGALMILAGFLFSPVKEFTLRCHSNPAHWLENQCAEFRHFHSPAGYAFFLIGLALIVTSFLVRRRNGAKDV